MISKTTKSRFVMERNHKTGYKNKVKNLKIQYSVTHYF